MKTITPKDALKLFLFLFILFSAKAFSHPKLPTIANPSDCESRIGVVKKTTNTAKTTSASRGNAGSKLSLKVATVK